MLRILLAVVIFVPPTFDVSAAKLFWKLAACGIFAEAWPTFLLLKPHLPRACSGQVNSNHDMAKCLALIPARGGSKGVLRKNIALVGGKPLLAWTIESALKANCIERVIVSTDDEQIAQVARDLGAEVPFLRPAELARDDTRRNHPLLHAVEWLAAHENYFPEWVILLQPTSPLRSSDDIEAAFALALDRHADAVVSITPACVHPFWTKKIDETGRLSDFVASNKSETRRQDPLLPTRPMGRSI